MRTLIDILDFNTSEFELLALLLNHACYLHLFYNTIKVSKYGMAELDNYELERILRQSVMAQLNVVYQFT